MTKKMLLAGIAASALILTACGGDSPSASSQSPTAPAASTAVAASPEASAPATEASAATETSSAAPASDAAPAGDLPTVAGPVDSTEFAKVLSAAMADVTTIKTTSTPANSEPSESFSDITDRSNPITYNVSKFQDSMFEIVSDNTGVWTRTDGGAWEFKAHDAKLLELIKQQGDTYSPEYLAQIYQNLQLVDPATQEYTVVMDLSRALGGTPSAEGQGMPVTIFLDENNRIAKQVIELGELSVVNDLEYNVDVQIPEVG